MTVLSDGTIKAMCGVNTLYSPLITPYNPRQQQPASYDMQLGSVRRNGKDYKTLNILPGEFLLASTMERVDIPRHLVGRIEGKSSVARNGIIIESAGLIDPGFEGTLTLEISNLSNKEFPLISGMLIAQVRFETLDKPALIPYGSKELGSHYQGQTGPTPAAY